jgi:hypothetical protein
LPDCRHLSTQTGHTKLKLKPQPHPPPKRLRFDFSNNGAVDAAKLAKVEAICREWVAAGLPVSSKEVSLADAKAVKGLRAVFGEVRGGLGWGAGRGAAAPRRCNCQPARVRVPARASLYPTLPRVSRT